MKSEKPVVRRLLGKAGIAAPNGSQSEPNGSAKRSLYARAHGVKPDPLDTKREAALLQSTAAKLVMTRHRVEQLRDALIERDRSQSEVTTATAELIDQLATAALETPILEAIAADLGDIEVEALRVTR